MKKRLVALVLFFVMTFVAAVPAMAVESDDSGNATGEITLSGEIEYTTAYTLVIPAGINNMDLSQDAQTTIGDVTVVKRNDNAEFDPSKKVCVTVNYDGELVNTKDSSKKVLYKLTKQKGDAAASNLTTGNILTFTAADIESEDVAYTLNAVVTETNKAGGTYSGTITFSASVVKEMVGFTVFCDRLGNQRYEVEPGTTWRQFAATESNFSVYNGSIEHPSKCESMIKKYGTTENVDADTVIEAGSYKCSGTSD